MGSWNETCFLTGLAIRPGDKCRVIILQAKGYGFNSGGLCYVDDAYTMKSMPLLGEYADYGNIEKINEDCVFTKAAVESLQKTMTPTREDSFHVQFFEPKDGTLYQFLDAIERGEALAEDSYMKSYGVKDGLPEDGKIVIEAKDAWAENSQLRSYLEFLSKKASYLVPVGLIMILGDAYQATSKTPITNWRNYNKETHKYEKTSAEDTCATLVEIYTKSAKEKKKWDELDKKSDDFRFDFDDMLFLRSPLETFIGSLQPRDMNFPDLAIIEKAMEGKDISKDCMEVARMIHFRLTCSMMRKAFFPCAGKGSQSDDEQFPAIRLVMDSTKAIIDSREKEYETQAEEDEKDYQEYLKEEAAKKAAKKKATKKKSTKKKTAKKKAGQKKTSKKG